MPSLRCKMTRCDLNDCGVCRRCGEGQASHDWVEAERDHPCVHRKRCTRCDASQEKPDHDWDTKTGGVDGIQMTCTRCGRTL